ncbi:MAG: TolB-like 6-bladed beta-propeller domain-containing protein [Tannerella sp.]|jgi:hypothetical protein|nr:TolB-like 6-bladed beta-propeller domain-containing protein [Tannerella sp.]
MVSILLAGCDSNEYIEIKDAVIFNDKSFKEVKMLSHTDIDTEFIGNPVRMTKVDTFLYIVDSSIDSVVHLFDVKNNLYRGLMVGRGTGPNELLSSGYVHPSPDNQFVWLYDITGRQWVKYGKANVGKISVMTEKIRFVKDTFATMTVEDPVWISDSLFVCVNLNSFKERFYFFDRQLKHKPVYNPRFSFKKNAPDFVLNEMFSILLNVKPDKSKIVLGGRYFDCLEVYHSSGILSTLTKGPEKGFNFNYDRQRSYARGAMIKSPETRRAYLCLKSTDERIYALYSGKEKQDVSNYSNSDVVFTFDWEGKPLTKYVLDCQIISFDVDENNKKIYAIREPEKSIIYFDLN